MYNVHAFYENNTQFTCTVHVLTCLAWQLRETVDNMIGSLASGFPNITSGILTAHTT